MHRTHLQNYQYIHIGYTSFRQKSYNHKQHLPLNNRSSQIQISLNLHRFIETDSADYEVQHIAQQKHCPVCTSSRYLTAAKKFCNQFYSKFMLKYTGNQNFLTQNEFSKIRTECSFKPHSALLCSQIIFPSMHLIKTDVPDSSCSVPSGILSAVS